MSLRAAVIRTCWLPAALYGGTLWYVRQYEGWGRWAAAPLLLPALALSGIMFAIGAWQVGTTMRQGRRDVPLIVATLLAGSVLLYVVVGSLTR